MEDTMHIARRLALLPDGKLEQLMRCMMERHEEPDSDSAAILQHLQPEERLAAISRELRDRGILGPPWWSCTA